VFRGKELEVNKVIAIRATRRTPTVLPEDEAATAQAALDNLIADDLTGPVGDAEWERAARENGNTDFWATAPRSAS
jgi:hypothetical protein